MCSKLISSGVKLIWKYEFLEMGLEKKEQESQLLGDIYHMGSATRVVLSLSTSLLPMLLCHSLTISDNWKCVYTMRGWFLSLFGPGQDLFGNCYSGHEKTEALKSRWLWSWSKPWPPFPRTGGSKAESLAADCGLGAGIQPSYIGYDWAACLAIHFP